MRRADPRTADIAIVTCSYQQSSFLEAAMWSVLNQRGVAVDYVVIDGGSTDGSDEIIRNHSAQLAHFEIERDRGQSHALNKGFASVHAEILGWLCSDDLLLPGALEFVVNYFRCNPTVDAIYGDSVLIDSDGKIIKAKREISFYPWIVLNDHNYIPQPSMFWRKRLLDEVGLIDEALHYTMDEDLWLRFATKAKIVHVPRFLSCMRVHPAQKVGSSSRNVAREVERLRLKYHGTAPRSGAGNHISRLLARIARVTLKTAAGGYRSEVPEPIRLQIEQLRTPK